MSDIRDGNYAANKTQRLFEILNKQNNDVIEVICERIDKLHAKDINQLISVFDYSFQDLSRIKKIIALTTHKTLSEIEKIFTDTARDNVHFANVFYKYRGLTRSIETDFAIRQLVKGISGKTQKEFLNLSDTTVVGFLNQHGQFRNIKQSYYDIIDNAIVSIATGKENYYTAVQKSIESMGESGLRAKFEGVNARGEPYVYTRRLDSQVNMNVQDGIRQLSTEIQKQTAQEYGADGVEISAHAICAPDHVNIQGKQFSNDEFEHLQATLKRPISTMNCRHFAFPIVLGVTKSVYTEKELLEMEKNSRKAVNYKYPNGKEKQFTKYDATQHQRQLETKIRKKKEMQKAYENAGDKLNVARCKKEIRQLNKEYKDFSLQVGLKPEMKRTKIFIWGIDRKTWFYV